jgi:hypothetical protein
MTMARLIPILLTMFLTRRRAGTGGRGQPWLQLMTGHGEELVGVRVAESGEKTALPRAGDQAMGRATGGAGSRASLTMPRCWASSAVIP